MFKCTWLIVGVILLAAGAALSAPETNRDLKANERAKSKVAREVFDQLMARYRNEQGYDVDDLAFRSQRILDAELAATADAAERKTAREAHLARTTEIEKTAASHFRVGQATQTDALAAEYYRLDAQSQLAAAEKQ